MNRSGFQSVFPPSRVLDRNVFGRHRGWLQNRESLSFTSKPKMQKHKKQKWRMSRNKLDETMSTIRRQHMFSRSWLAAHISPRAS